MLCLLAREKLSLLRIDKERLIYEPEVSITTYSSCTRSRSLALLLVYCNSFNVLMLSFYPGPLSPESECKVTPTFSFTQIFLFINIFMFYNCCWLLHFFLIAFKDLMNPLDLCCIVPGNCADHRNHNHGNCHGRNTHFRRFGCSGRETGV